MVIFNQTFTQGKHIYFPDNWGTGKTAIQIHQQWKQTLSFALISNILQILASVGWIFIIVIVILASKEIIRLYSLKDQSRQKLQNRKYIQKKFILWLVIMGTVWCSLTFAFLTIDEWNRTTFMKGLFVWAIIIAINYFHPKVKSFYANYKKRKALKNKIQSSNINQTKMRQQ